MATVTNVAFTLNFTLYLVWEMPAGGGAQGNVIYTLGTRTWWVVFRTNSNANAWANQILPASGVFVNALDFNPNDHSDPVVIQPTANLSAQIR